MIEVSTVRLRRSERLVVAFGGIRGKLGGLKYEFHNSLERLDCAALFVADTERRWYQYEAPVLADILERVRSAAREAGASRLVFIGNSMGGYAALYFGARLGADAILAFATQTAILPEVTRELGDDRWEEHQALIPCYPFGDLAKEAPATGRAVLCLSEGSAQDRAHAERLAGAWPIEQIRIPGDTHAVAAQMREAGELLPLLERTIAG